MMKVFRHSKINLNFTGVSYINLFDQEHSSQWNFKQIKGRCQEIALNGGFVMTEEAFGINKLFNTENEITTFSDGTELLNKVKYFLANQSEREEYRQNAYKRARNDYTAVAGWAKINQHLIDLKPRHGPEKIFIDYRYIKTLNTQRLVRSVKFLISGNLKSFGQEVYFLKLKFGINAALFNSLIRRELRKLIKIKRSV